MQVQEAGAKTVRRPAGSCIILFPLNKLPLANSYFLLKSVKMKLFVLNTKKNKLQQFPTNKWTRAIRRAFDLYFSIKKDQYHMKYCSKGK